MMDILFYKEKGESFPVELSSGLYEWLAHSSFSKIQKSKEFKREVENETITINAVFLDESARNNYILFFQNEILRDSFDLVNKLDSINRTEVLKASAPEGSIQELIYRIKKFHEILNHLQEREFVYLEYC